MDTCKGGRNGGKVLKRHKHRKSNLLYNQITGHALAAALMCGLLFPYPHWFPSLCSSTNHNFLLIPFPYIWSYLCNPKCLFFVVNVIVIFLVGESRRETANAPPVSEIYEEYVKRSRRMRRAASLQEKKAGEEKRAEAAERVVQVQVKEDQIEEAQLVVKELERAGDEAEIKGKAVEEHEEENKAGKEKEKEEEEEEEGGLMPTEELNKRVEEFIARVNRQRWIEARLPVISCKA